MESNPRCPRVIASMRERKIMRWPILSKLDRSDRGGSGRSLLHQRVQRVCETWIGIQHWRAPQLDPERIGPLFGLDVDVVEDLEVVGDEPDRRNQDCAVALGGEPLDRLDQARAKPRLPRVALALVREAPLLDAGPLSDQLRGAQQLLLVGIALIEDARRQAV